MKRIAYALLSLALMGGSAYAEGWSGLSGPPPTSAAEGWGGETSPSPSSSPRPDIKTAAPDTDFDPFANQKLDQQMPPLACMPKAKFMLAVAMHGGSDLVTLTPTAAAFYKGYFSAQQFTPPGFPIGDKVELSVKAISDEEGNASTEGVVVFGLGDNLVCNHLAVTEVLLNQIWQAGGARAKDGM